jgi:hypothetical protein
MQETQKERIAAGLQAYIEKGNSQAQAEKLCGVSGANISHIVNRKWKNEERPAGAAVGDGIFQKVQLGLGLRLNVVPTDNFLTVSATLAKAKQKARCIVVDGETGAGKTFACEEFQRRAPQGTLLVTMDTNMSAQDLLAALAKQLGLDMPRGRSNSLGLELVVERLLRFAHPLVVLDEMETAFEPKSGDKNKVRARSIFGLVKDLQRKTAGRVGIVLVGAGLWERLMERVKYNSGSFPQLVSRFKQVPPVLLSVGIGREDEDAVGAAFALGGRKGLRAALESYSDQRPCETLRDLFWRLEEMQTVAGIVEKQAA